MGSNLLFQLDSIEFEFTMRSFFAGIVRFLFNFAGKCVDLLYDVIAPNRFGLDEQVSRITNSFFIILLIFMIFRLTIKLLNYLIDPDSVFDKGTGFSTIIKRVVIGIILLISINPMFKLLYDLQGDILDNRIISSIILGNETQGKIVSSEGVSHYYPIRADYLCPDNYYIVATSKGDALALQALLPFYTLNDPAKVSSEKLSENLQKEIDSGANGYCGWKFENESKIGQDIVLSETQEEAEKLLNKVKTGTKVVDVISMMNPLTFAIRPLTKTLSNSLVDQANQTYQQVYSFPVSDVDSLISPTIYLDSVNENGNVLWTIAESAGALVLGPVGMLTEKVVDAFRVNESMLVVNFHYFWAILFGIIFTLLIISFCFDVVIRAFTLFVYQILAPVPIILYMSPIKKDNEVLNNWFKKVISCWGSLFIRLAILDFIILMINIILNDSTVLSLKQNGPVLQIIIICGALMFAKKLPKVLEDVIPGMKFEGVELNPFKRFKKDALGSEPISDLTGRTLGLATGLAGGLVAGAQAGGEVGNLGRGLLSGAINGASTGFKNKKASFGNSMNQAYKNLTGNDMNNLTFSSFILSNRKPGEIPEPVKEVKSFLKQAYDQRNKFLTDLNISENMTANMANSLLSQGIDVSAGSFEKQMADKTGRLQQVKDELNQNGILSDYAQTKQAYNAELQRYNAFKNDYDQRQSDYQKAQDNVSAIEQRIKDLQQQKATGSINGIATPDSYFDNQIRSLQAQKQSTESQLGTLKQALDSSKTNLESAKRTFDIAQNSFDQKTQVYNEQTAEMRQLETEINNLSSNKVQIEAQLTEYNNRRAAEEDMRATISAIDKDIETLKGEKSQREKFYRVDSYPKQDYEDAQAHLHDRQNDIDGNTNS